MIKNKSIKFFTSKNFSAFLYPITAPDRMQSARALQVAQDSYV